MEKNNQDKIDERKRAREFERVFSIQKKKLLWHSVASFAFRAFVTPISRVFLPRPARQSSRERVAGKRAEKETLLSSIGGVM